jgi:hypothetical protein
MIPLRSTTINLHKGYHPENTTDEADQQKNNKSAANIHLPVPEVFEAGQRFGICAVE